MASTRTAARPLSHFERLPSSLHLILRSYFDHYSTDHFHLAESSQTLLAEHLTFEEFRIEWCTDKDPTALSSLLLRQEGLRVVEIAQEGLAAFYAAVCKGACQEVLKLSIFTRKRRDWMTSAPFSSTHLHFLALALTWDESFPSLTWLDIQSTIDPTQTLAVPILALALTRSVPYLQRLSLVNYRHDVLAFDAWANMLEMRQERVRRRECEPLRSF